MDKLFNSVWSLRIVALILALALFTYVKADINAGRETANSKDVEILYNVPLEVYQDDESLIVTGLPESVNITVSGSAQEIIQMKISQDYVVFVDLNNLTIGEYHVPIQHEGFSDKLNISIEPASVNIMIEESVSKELRVDPEMNNRLIAEDYVLKEMVAEPKTVVVTGAKSMIESISYVKATVTGEQGIEQSFEQEANVKVLNAELNRLDVQVEPEKVKVNVTIEQYSKEIPLTLKKVGKLESGTVIESLSLEPTKVKVTGKKAVIDELSELVVEFDVSELDESGTYNAQIQVPEGITIESDKVKVHADIDRKVALNIDNEEM